MHATPFANSVAVGTEGCAGAVEALHAAADSVTLLRLVVSGAKPRPAAMLARAIAGQTTATAYAEQLVVEEGLSFREAHHIVGQRLTEAEGRPDSILAAGGLDPARVARAARFGGGPGGSAPLDDLRRRRSEAAAELGDRVRRWHRADAELAAAVAALLSSERSPALARARGTA
jgi:argininosuccinate lyase